MKLKLDLHVHTTNSRDAFTKLEELASLCKTKGLDGVAITDHNKLCHEIPGELTAIRGMEISSIDGHVIGLGLTGPVMKGLSADETIREIHRLKGLAIIPHPYDMFRSSVNPELLRVRPDAVEVVNASSLIHKLSWEKARSYARAMRIPPVAGSDSHIPQTVGSAYTLVENDSDDPTSILDAIKAGSVSPVEGTIHLSHRFRKLLLQAGRPRRGGLVPSGTGESAFQVKN